MADVAIRPAQEGDRAAVEALLETSWLTYWAPHVEAHSIARFERERPVNAYVETYIDRFMVAVRGGIVLGMYHLEGDVLHAIHVHAVFMGTGIGQALMSHAERRGARRLDVRAFNVRAREFYERRGWRAIAEAEESEMGTAVRTILMERG